MYAGHIFYYNTSSCHFSKSHLQYLFCTFPEKFLVIKSINIVQLHKAHGLRVDERTQFKHFKIHLVARAV